MPVAIVTGSGGLIGSETARFLHEKGMDVVGIDNDMRSYFFGPEASTAWNTARLESELPRYTHRNVDVRDETAVQRLFAHYGQEIALVVHTAAQPSHDWAAREPVTDFTVNANGLPTSTVPAPVALSALRPPKECLPFTSTRMA